MMRRAFLYLTFPALFVGPVHLVAHENFRIIGTITKAQATQLTVKTKERPVSVKVDKQTAFTRDSKKISAPEVKVGQSVVVEAYGDSFDDLLAIEVRIVPPIRKPK